MENIRRAVSVFTALAVATAIALLGNVSNAGANGVAVTSHFVVTDDPATNVIGDSAYLDNGATNAVPHAIVFMALNDTPGGVCGCAIATKPLGVWYDPTRQEWAVFNEDSTAMSADPSFNILVLQRASPGAFILRAAHANTAGNRTMISSKLLNGNPLATLQVTQDFNPGGSLAGTLNDHPVGVKYLPAFKRWAVFNEDNSPIPLGAAFNILVGSTPSNGGSTVLVTVTSFDHHIGTILVNSLVTNGNPNNVTFVTQVFNPGGKGAVSDPHPLEVAYPNAGSAIDRETIDNSDFSTSPIGARFNVLTFPS